MKHSRGHTYLNIFSNCRRILGDQTWGRVLEALGDETEPQDIPDKLDSLKPNLHLPEYIPDLSRVEWALSQVSSDPAVSHQKYIAISVNPSLKLVPVGWKQLSTLMSAESGKEPVVEISAGTHVMIWRHPKTDKTHIREANDTDLLSLKITVEKTNSKTAAAMGDVAIGVIDRAIRHSISEGNPDITSIPYPKGSSSGL